MQNGVLTPSTAGRCLISNISGCMRHRYAFASRRTSVRQNASRRVKTTASADTNLKPQIQHTWHLLPDGTKLEVLTQTSHHERPSANPPLLMLHGSGHAAWCYQENFMPYFADRGYDTYAISFRCQGCSDAQSNAKSAGTLDSHSADIQHFVKSLPKPPVILAHSFGGLIAQRYVLGDKDRPPSAEAASTAGLVLLASSPPYGNSSLVGRTMRRRPLFSIRLTWGFIRRSYAHSMPLFKEMFMSHDIPEDKLQRYHQLLQENMSPVQLVDLRQLNKQELPLQRPRPDFSTPVLALVGDQDLVVDLVAAQETAAHFGQGNAAELKGLAHDLMLDTRWQQAASTILEWLQRLDHERLKG